MRNDNLNMSVCSLLEQTVVHNAIGLVIPAIARRKTVACIRIHIFVNICNLNLTILSLIAESSSRPEKHAGLLSRLHLEKPGAV
jgi:hypothetical protein